MTFSYDWFLEIPFVSVFDFLFSMKENATFSKHAMFFLDILNAGIKSIQNTLWRILKKYQKVNSLWKNSGTEIAIGNWISEEYFMKKFAECFEDGFLSNLISFSKLFGPTICALL